MKLFRGKQLFCFKGLSQILSYEFQSRIQTSFSPNTPAGTPPFAERGGKDLPTEGVVKEGQGGRVQLPQWASALPPRRQKTCRRVEGSALCHPRAKQNLREPLPWGWGQSPLCQPLRLPGDLGTAPFSLKRPRGTESSPCHRATDFPVRKQAAAASWLQVRPLLAPK